MLTNRERDVLALAARGNTNQNIADELGISCRTVKCILHHACVKLRAQNRTQALFMALCQGHLGMKEVFSSEELTVLFSFVDPEMLDGIKQRLKRQRGRLLSNPECLPNIKGKRLSITVSNSKLAAYTGARRNLRN